MDVQALVASAIKHGVTAGIAELKKTLGCQ